MFGTKSISYLFLALLVGFALVSVAHATTVLQQYTNNSANQSSSTAPYSPSLSQAEPVIGVIALVAIIAAVAWYLNGRKSSTRKK